VNERDLRPVRARPWHVVDQADPAGPQLVQRLPKIGDAKREVMKPGTARRQEAGDG
jgi:hypothetical protein